MSLATTTPHKNNDGPDATCKFYNDQKPVWKMVDTLLAGTTAMRVAGKDYLPPFPNETEINYQHRLQRTTLLNYFKRTITGLVGKPFSKAISVPEEMDDQLKACFRDMDRQGSDLDAFARAAFRVGLAKSMVHILVDYPVNTPLAEGDVKTLADEREEGATPYAIMIEPQNLLAAFSEYQDGMEVLTHVRIKECTVERDEWSEVLVERIRVLEPGTWTLWKKEEGGKYVEEASGTTSLDYIPLVTWYTEREAFMRSRAPLLDLAHKNIEHWQSSSDQRNILSVTRFPILGASGVDPESKLEIGPNSYFALREPAASMYYVEHSGAAVGAGRQDMEDLKTEMAMMGLQLLMPQASGGQTATAKAMDGAEANCGLQSMVLDFNSVLNRVVDMFCDWLGIEQDEEAEKLRINSDFGVGLGAAQDMQVLLAARQTKEISHEAFIAALKRRDILAEDFDVEADKELIDEEKAAEPPPVEGMPPRFGGPSRFGGRPNPFQKKSPTETPAPTPEAAEGA